MGYFQAFDYRMLWYRRDEVFFMAKEELFIERRPQGDYAVRRGGAERASAVEPTQAEAIERAKEINNGGQPESDSAGLMINSMESAFNEASWQSDAATGGGLILLWVHTAADDSL